VNTRDWVFVVVIFAVLAAVLAFDRWIGRDRD
jgi:hypothetical protein